MSDLEEFNKKLDRIIFLLSEFIKNPSSNNNIQDAMERQKALDIFDNMPDPDFYTFLDKMKCSSLEDETHIINDLTSKPKIFNTILIKVLEIICYFGQLEGAEDSDKQKYWFKLIKEKFSN
jgi:hypothetical protein